MLSPAYEGMRHGKVIRKFRYSNMEALSIFCHALQRIFPAAIVSTKEDSHSEPRTNNLN